MKRMNQPSSKLLYDIMLIYFGKDNFEVIVD